MKYTLNETLLNKLPTPFVQTLEVFFKEDHEQQAFRSVHRLIDAIEVFCKLYTVASVSTFLEVLKEQIDSTNTLNEKEFEKIKVMLAAGLKTPSLGIWWSFARDTAKVLNAINYNTILPDFNQQLTHKNSKIKKAFDGDNNLITFRNSYAHGATPSENACAKELKEKWLIFEKLIEEASPLMEANLIICLDKGTTLLAKGNILQPITLSQKTEKGHVYFQQEEKLVNLFPLLTFTEDKNGGVNFFFYNDLKDKYANYLNYPNSEHQHDVEKKEFLLNRIPINEWKKIGNADLNPFKEQIELLTEVFKGRQDELQKTSDFITTNNKGFLTIFGPPGVGKSALLARVTQLLNYAPEIRAQLETVVKWPELKVHIVEYFIRRGATETASDLFDSLCQRMDYRYALKMELGKTDEERRKLFEKRLLEVSKQLKDDERLLIIIDGLDEAKAGDPLMSLLPRTVPEKVLVIYGSRPQAAIKFSFYEELDREHRAQFDLGGLSLADIRAVMMESVNKYELRQKYVASVLVKSEGNPLYLKLLCKGLEQNIYKLNDSDILPAGMKELYTNALFKMENEHPGATNYLNLLAASHDFISPQMAADLIGIKLSDFRNRILSACLELLYENPLTEQVEDYQLFHESLREYLKETYPKEISEWNEKLSYYCSHWIDEKGDQVLQDESLAYAMSFAAVHLYDSWIENKKNNKNSVVSERKKMMLSLIENKEWRYKNFEISGNANALGIAYTLCQKVIIADDTEGKELAKVIQYGYDMHNEPLLMYLNQRERLQKNIATKDLASHLDTVIRLANMGENASAKLLLMFTALWSSDLKGITLPATLISQSEEWLDLAREKPLSKLWKFTLERIN